MTVFDGYLNQPDKTAEAIDPVGWLHTGDISEVDDDGNYRFITVKPGATAPTLDELVSYLLSKDIAKNKLPERLVVIPEMPLTPTRKVIKSRLIAALSSPA